MLLHAFVQLQGIADNGNDTDDPRINGSRQPRGPAALASTHHDEALQRVTAAAGLYRNSRAVSMARTALLTMGKRADHIGSAVFIACAQENAISASSASGVPA